MVYLKVLIHVELPTVLQLEEKKTLISALVLTTALSGPLMSHLLLKSIVLRSNQRQQQQQRANTLLSFKIKKRKIRKKNYFRYSKRQIDAHRYQIR